MKQQVKKIRNEVIDVDGSKVYIENGEVKVKLNEEKYHDDYISVEDCFDMAHKIIDEIYATR